MLTFLHIVFSKNMIEAWRMLCCWKKARKIWKMWMSWWSIMTATVREFMFCKARVWKGCFCNWKLRKIDKPWQVPPTELLEFQKTFPPLTCLVWNLGPPALPLGVGWEGIGVLSKASWLWSSLFMELSDFAVTCPLKFPNPFKIRWKWSIWVWNSNSHIYIKVSPKSPTVFMKLNWMMLTHIWYIFSVKTGKYLLVLRTLILVFFIPFADCKP